ncbi:MAG: RluA family pseudouridine synthase [Lachnospiraceae bacterium]|nr:RluA family pseudouridine synthase [Lachnospiraceae bacterium]
MIRLIIDEKNEGGRLDKYLRRHLPAASTGFLYKMLRKKNITLNERKAAGNELLKKGDEIRLFFSDETYEKLSASDKSQTSREISVKLPGSFIVYEDQNLILINKPAGLLSQRDKSGDPSANDYCLALLNDRGEDMSALSKDFTPSVCNRLDRNTSGLMIFAKNYGAAREIGDALRERRIEKYYLALVKGRFPQETGGSVLLTGYLHKDTGKNLVTVTNHKEMIRPAETEIKTSYEALSFFDDFTLCKIRLFTGKSHQIRAQLSAEGHPVLGDPKYGDKTINEALRKQYQIRGQLLHAWELKMPVFSGVLKNISGRSFRAPLPDTFEKCGVREIQPGTGGDTVTDGNMEDQGTAGIDA